VIKSIFVLFVVWCVFAWGCSSTPTVQRRDVGVPIVIDTTIRISVPLPDMHLSTPVLPTTSTVEAPEVMLFENRNSRGQVTARVKVNNRTQTVSVTQEPVQHEQRFVYATTALVRQDTISATSGKVFPVLLWVVGSFGVVALLIVGIVLYLQYRYSTQWGGE